MSKYILLAAVVLSLVVVTMAASSIHPLTGAELEAAFTSWASQHGKTYQTEAIRTVRKGIWARNLAFIQRHNTRNDKTYKVAMNEFGDLTNAEFARTYLRPIDLNAISGRSPLYTIQGDPPATQDWRTSGAVTKIKNQGQCGSCWSFSTTGTVEGAWKIAGNSLTSFSEQQLMDCSESYGNDGCNGGLPFWALQYIIDNNGIETEKDYPYETEQGRCRFKSSKIAGHISSYVNITSGSEDDLQDAVGNTGPVSVGIDASNQSFQFYSSGVYNEPNCSSTQLDHGVLAIGYDHDDDSNEDYWIVKNSWGTSWGQSGYIWMARNQDNMCGIATMAAIPSV
jgi:cathepsin L